MAATLPLTGKRVIILIGNDYEELELHYPRLRLMEAGAEVFIAGPKAKPSTKANTAIRRCPTLASPTCGWRTPTPW